MDQSGHLIAQHVADHSKHRFSPVIFRGEVWDLSHLDPFAFKCDLGEENQSVVVVVIFSCHCFTHKAKHDGRNPIPSDELFILDGDRRVLNEERYQLSKELLTQIVLDLSRRRITVADDNRNFVTLERFSDEGVVTYYGVYFEAKPDKQRGGRVILRIQSAYAMDKISKRQEMAKKVRFSVLIKATMEGRRIHG